MTRDPLLEAFARLVADRPEAVLVASPSHRVTVARVEALARAAGRCLEAGKGSGAAAPGEPVGLQAGNGPAFLAAILALRRAGLAPVLLDRRTPALERSRIAADVGARFVLVARCAWATGPEDFHLEPVPIAAAETAGAGAAGSEPTEARASAAAGLGDVAVPAGTSIIKLSSGTTGSARGIATTSEALLADEAALAASMGIGDRDRLLATIPFSHSYGLSSLVVPALARGNLLVLPDHDGPFGPLAAAADAGATVFPTVPAYLGALNRLNEPPPLPPTLRLVLTAGALLAGQTSADFRHRYGLAPHVFYGASECGGICYDREGGAAERGTVGSPVDGVTVERLPVDLAVEGDGSGGEDISGGDPGGDLSAAGRVVVRSPALALAYLPPEPSRLDGERYVTDDLAVWRGGELVLAGRLNDLINVRGKKVNPREVEKVLRGLAGVEEAAVVGARGAVRSGMDGEGLRGEVPAPLRGDRGGCDREVVVRAVVACRPGEVTREDVVAWCRRHLADHKVPRSVVLVEALPRTERGKVDRSALAGLLDRDGVVAGCSPAGGPARAGAGVDRG